MCGLEIPDATAPDRTEAKAWLRQWRWLIPPDFEAICATAIGDAFLQDAHGSVWWLDAGSGTLERIGTQTDWRDRLSDAGQLDAWSARVLVRRLETAGLRLKLGECYTYVISPILGGLYVPSNFKVVPIQTHFDFWGDILKELKDLPDGATVTFELGG